MHRIAYLPDEAQIVTACFDQCARVFSTKTGVLLRTFTGHENGVYGLAVLGSDLIASGDLSGVLCVWRARTGRCLYRAKQEGGSVLAIAALDSSRFVAGLDDGSLIFYHHREGEDVLALRSIPHAHEARIRSIAICGNRLVTGSSDKTAKVWDVDTREVCGTLAGHAKFVQGVAMDERHIVTTSNGGRNDVDKGGVYIWDATTFALLQKLEDTHTDWIYLPLLLGADHVLTVSADQSILVSAIATGTAVHRIHPNFGVFHLATTRDGKIAACGNNESAVIFSAPEPVAKIIRANVASVAAASAEREVRALEMMKEMNIERLSAKLQAAAPSQSSLSDWPSQSSIFDYDPSSRGLSSAAGKAALAVASSAAFLDSQVAPRAVANPYIVADSNPVRGNNPVRISPQVSSPPDLSTPGSSTSPRSFPSSRKPAVRAVPPSAMITSYSSVTPQVAPRGAANPTLVVKSTPVSENCPVQSSPQVAPPPNSSTYPPSLLSFGKPAFHPPAFSPMITSDSAVVPDRASTEPKSSALNEKNIRYELTSGVDFGQSSSITDFDLLKRRGINAEEVKEMLDTELATSIAAYLISYNVRKSNYFSRLRESLTTSLDEAGVFGGDALVGEDSSIESDLIVDAIMNQFERDDLVTLATAKRLSNYMKRLGK